MYKNIVIIGLGSLGGFLAENISRMKGLQSLILIDPDVVELRNIGRSIYRRIDLGRYKVEALKSIIKDNNEDLKISSHPIEYYEGRIYIPSSDLVIDCRDIICCRNGDIDIRMYITFRTLVIDCKRFFRVTNQKIGKYIQGLNMGELSAAASIGFQIIDSGKSRELIKNQMIHQVSMDYQSNRISKAVVEYESRPDYIIDCFNGDDKIKNLHETLPMIIDSNQIKSLTVIIGQENCIGDRIKKINRGEIIGVNSAVRILSEIIQSIPSNSEYYTIVVNKDRDEWFLELLPETGAA